MTLLQLTAARLAGVARVYFYTGDAAGTAIASKAISRLNELAATSSTPNELLRRILALGLSWGRSDGN
jgi:hypothetical protein